MPGRIGLFGPSRFTIEPDRSKFDPDLHPEHAPSVPEDKADAYFELVMRRVPRVSGATAASALLHKRDGKAWISFGTAYGGIATEWGSYAMPAKRILSSSARKIRGGKPTAAQEKAADRLKLDAKGRLRAGLKQDLIFNLDTSKAPDRAAIATARSRIAQILTQGMGPRAPGALLNFGALRLLTRRATAVEAAATPAGRRLLAKLHRSKSIRDISELLDRLVR